MILLYIILTSDCSNKILSSTEYIIYHKSTTLYNELYKDIKMTEHKQEL